MYDFFLYDLTTSLVLRSHSVQETLIENLEKLLKKAAHGHWSVILLTEELTKVTVNEDHATVFIKFWQSEREKIHKFLQSKQFNGHLEVREYLKFTSSSLSSPLTHLFVTLEQRTAWRIDIQTATKRKDEMNKPVAIMEFKVKKPDESKKIVQFEMERNELSNLLKKFDDIASVIQKRSS